MTKQQAIIRKIRLLQKEMDTHDCLLTEFNGCICTSYRKQQDKALIELHIANGLEPVLLEKKGGSTEPF